MNHLLRRTAAFFRWVFIPKSIRELIIGAPLLAFLAVTGYLYFLDREPIISSQWATLTPVVQQGDYFRIQYHVRWGSRCRVTGYRFIVDGAGYRHERIVDTRYVDAGDESFVISIRVPLGAAPGAAQYRGEIEYVCNLIQQLFPIRRQLTIRQFEIVPGEPSASSLSMACPMDRPVWVRSHCRSDPQMAIVLD